ncbi:MAG: DUF898 domain-containing protein [Deltaproteobacteria bacterium]|nr:DUF898 domain-containing protein [Deltaproteobacteria bacterium]
MVQPKLRNEEGRQGTFHGRAGTLFGIVIVNVLLTIVTVGVFHFWGKTRVRRFFCSHTEFDGDRFEYHGTGFELFVGALKGLCFFGLPVIAALYYFREVAVLPVYLFAALLAPFALHSARRYRMSRISWRGVRFSFRGPLGACYAIMIPGVLLSALTLGLYFPYFRARMVRYWFQHTYFGRTPLGYDGVGKDLFQIYLAYWLRILGFIVGMIAIVAASALLASIHPLLMIVMQIVLFASYLVALLSVLWWRAAEHRFHWGHTGILDARFYSDMTGGALFVLYLVHGLVAVLTLGFGFAWILVDRFRFHLSRVTLYGQIDFEKVVHDLEQADVEAVGEGVADALDIGDIGLGLG